MKVTKDNWKTALSKACVNKYPDDAISISHIYAFESALLLDLMIKNDDYEPDAAIRYIQKLYDENALQSNTETPQ